MSEEVRNLRPGEYILYKNQPYQIKKNQIVVTGTHSHTKNKLDLKALFSEQSESVVLPPHDRFDTIEILRKKAQVLSKVPSLQVMDMISYETFDAIADENVLSQLNEGDEVTFVEFNNLRKVIDKRS